MKQSSKRRLWTLAPWLAAAVLGGLVVAPAAATAGQPDGEARPEAALATAVTAVDPSLGENLRLTSVAAFNAEGGTALIEPGTPREEVVSYSAVDPAASTLVGISRGVRPIAHRDGSSVVSLDHAPAVDQPRDAHAHSGAGHASGPDHTHGPAPEGDPMHYPPRPVQSWGLHHPEPDPDQAWLDEHCKSDPSDLSAPNILAPLFVYNAYTGSTTSGWQKKMRDEIYAADRALIESNKNFHQHFRLACNKDASGRWLSIWTPSYPIQEASGTATVTDCSDILENLRWKSYWSAGNRRYISFVDWSLDSTEHNCSWAHADAVNSDPGTQNLANSIFGYAQIDPYDWTPDGTWNLSTPVVLHELFHTWGLVRGGPGWDGWVPQAQRVGGGAHSYDYPDVMNAGYYHPPTIATDCRGTLPWYTLTHENSFVDCGNDTYWNYAPAPGSYLCTHFNLATDSLYFHPRAQRNC